MPEVIAGGRIPILNWCREIEPGAREQLAHLAEHPFAFHHIAVMPDCHEGYGMPIGGVLATEKVIIPNAVGVDIGCGMCAVKTSLERPQAERGKLERFLDAVRRAIPVGFNHHKRPQEERWMPPLDDDMPIVEREYNSARHQVGTLGGGNHFIEVQYDTEGFIWLMVHSGSRNIGLKVAEHYNKVAGRENEKHGERLPKNWQLDFLRVHSEEGQRYLREMRYCVAFAFNNRRLMMERLKEIFTDTFGEIGFLPLINIAHNYAEEEEHFGKKVMVHRKGATKATAGLIGIVPGSQGSPSYIAEGLGNPDSFQSCAHGAGRKMGRREAVKKLKFDDEVYRLERQGILHSLFRKADLEEAMGAYKDISEVMQAQADLVTIRTELKPLAVVKG